MIQLNSIILHNCVSLVISLRTIIFILKKLKIKFLFRMYTSQNHCDNTPVCIEAYTVACNNRQQCLAFVDC